MLERKLNESYPSYYRHEVYFYIESANDIRGKLNRVDGEIKRAVRALGGETGLPNQVEIRRATFRGDRHEVFFYLDSRSNFEVHQAELSEVIKKALENVGIDKNLIGRIEIRMIENLNINLRENKNLKESFERELELWDNLIDYEIATEEELHLITGINGLNIEALNDVLFYRTGYRDWEQFSESEGLEESKDLKENQVEHQKGFTLSFPGTDYFISKPYDLYELYNDFLIDHDNGSYVMDPVELSNVEYIREFYETIFYEAQEITSYWKSTDFEENFGGTLGKI